MLHRRFDPGKKIVPSVKSIKPLSPSSHFPCVLRSSRQSASVKMLETMALAGDSDLGQKLKNNSACRNTLILYGLVAVLWFIHYEKDDTHYSLPKQFCWRVFIYVDYTRAVVFLLRVPLYGFFSELKLPVHQWLFRILLVLLVQYQLDAIASFGTLYQSSCAPAFWRYTGKQSSTCWLVAGSNRHSLTLLTPCPAV